MAEPASDTVYYISARAREDGKDTRELAPAAEYGLAVLHRGRASSAEGGSAHRIVDSLVVDSATFVTRLRERLDQAPAPFDFAVLYVHGMGTSLHEAWEHTAAARTHGGRAVPWIVFCWPATGSAFSWPRSDALVTAAYWRDVNMVDLSRSQFVAALGTVRGAVPAPQLVLASHSLGGRLVGEAVRAGRPLHDELTQSPLRALAFLVPDVGADAFRDSIAPALPPIAARRVLYTARNDRALAVARRIIRSERAGLRTDAGAPSIDTGLVETVDITEAHTNEGWFQQHFGTHHAIRRKVGALIDLVQVVGAQRTPECRAQALFGTRAADGRWLLHRARPVPDSLAVCTPFVAPGAVR